MGRRIIMKNVLLLAFALIPMFTTVSVCAPSKNGKHQRRHHDDDDDDGLYGSDGAMKWAASVGPFSDDGEGRPHLSSDLIRDSTKDCRERASRAIGKAKDTCHAVQEEAGQVKEKMCETAREALHLTEEAVGRAKHKANSEKDAIADAVSGTHKAAKEIATTLGHDIAGNVTQAIEGGGLGSTVDLFASASAFGQGLWVTLMWGPSLRAKLPRQQLQRVESQMYGLYFKTMGSTVAMALLGHCFSPRNSDTIQSFNLSASLLLVLLNLAVLHPLSHRVRRATIKLENEETESESKSSSTATSAAMETLNRRARRLRLCSSLSNGTSLSAITWHLYFLCHRLSTTT